MADINLRIKADFAAAEKAFRDIAGSSENLQKKIEQMQKSFGPEQIDRFIEKNRLAATAIRATQGAEAGLVAETKGLQREIERLIRAGLSPESDQLKKLTSQYATLTAETAKLSKESSIMGDIIKGVLGANLIQKGIDVLVGGFKSIFTEAIKIEDAEAAFQPLMKGIEGSRKLVEALNVEASTTPYRFEDVAGVARQLLPVMAGDIEKVTSTFRMLGDTAGGNVQKLDSITRGFTKAMLKGKVDLEALNMIGEAGVPIMLEMAKTMGFGENQMGAFFDTVKNTVVPTDILVQTFKRMTSEGGLFFEGMIIASKTTSGVLSTTADSVSMLAAGIGKAFLPVVKDVAIMVSNAASGMLKWIQSGDNLSKTLSILGTVLVSVGAAVIGYNVGLAAYAVATNGAAIATGVFSAAMKALNVVMSLNPIGLIVGALTLLGVAIYKITQNWDQVKYAVTDFAYTSSIQLLEFSVTVREKVMGAIKDFLNLIGKIPGSDKFMDLMIESQDELTGKIKDEVAALKTSRAENEKTYQTKKAASEAAIAAAQKEAAGVTAANQQIIESSKEKALTLTQFLEKVTASQASQNRAQVEEARKFFETRAAMESEDGAKRLEWLIAQEELIKQVRFANNQERIAAEKGVAMAVEEEERKLFETKMKFAQSSVGLMSDTLADFQTVMKNSGKESRALAIAMKGLAMAQAAINTALAFTQALTLPFPMNWIQGALVVAAGVAKQAAIATTPIPSAQTGIEYTVPDTRTNRNDRAAVMASPGERVSVTPRGRGANDIRQINISIAEENIFSIFQRGIDTGKINISDRNLGTGVFAT